MKYKCECGKSHNFIKFKKVKRTWNGVSSYYQYFCRDLDKLMVLETTTYPKSITNLLCRNDKKFKRLSKLMTSKEFMN